MTSLIAIGALAWSVFVVGFYLRFAWHVEKRWPNG